MNAKIADNPPATTTDSGATGLIAPRQSRRRFVREVGVIVPVVLTVGSRSTLAQTCLSPSASASINLLSSRAERRSDSICAGRGPGFWKNHDHFEPAKTTQFSSVFPGGSGGSMKDVTGYKGNENFAALARHLAAAWCNLQRGIVSPTIINLADLQAMWAGRNGSYTPIKGGSVRWDAVQIVDYLKTTMT